MADIIDADEFFVPFKGQTDPPSHVFNWTYLEEWLNRKLHDGSIGTRGPIEVTYMVASSEARAEIREVADFECDGTDDEVEINSAFAEAKAAGLSCKVQLSAGGFYVTDQTIVDTAGSGWLDGAGEGVSVIWYDPDDWPATTPVVDVVDTHGRASNFTVEEESGCP